MEYHGLHSFKFLSEKGVALIRIWGEINVESARMAFAEFFCHQDFISNAKMIVDIRGVIKIEASFENIFWTSTSIGNESSRFPCDAKVVVLVSNSTQYGFTRIVAQVLDYLYSIEVISAFNEEDVLKHRGRCEVSFAQLISD
jgi:hypothetical protein